MQAIVSDDRPLTKAFFAIMTVAFMHVRVATLKQWSQGCGKVADGTPIVIIEHGEMQADWMRRLRLHEQDVMVVARAQGLESLAQITFAFVERNGTISIMRQEEQ